MTFLRVPELNGDCPGPHQTRQGRDYQATVGDFCQIGVHQPLTTAATLILSNTCKRRPVTQLIRGGVGKSSLGEIVGDYGNKIPDC